MAACEYKAKKGKSNPTTILMQTVVEACLALDSLSPYIYAASPKTNSVYIKFKFAAGTLRISNHKSKYPYKWNISINPIFVDRVVMIGKAKCYFSNYKNTRAFCAYILETNK